MTVRETVGTAKTRLHRIVPAVASLDAARCWHQLMEVSSDAIFILSGEDGRLMQASQSFSELLGYSLAELERMHVWDWDVHWTKAGFLKALEEDRGGWGRRRFVTRMRRRDGAIIDVEISGSWLDWQGRGQLVCVARDVTERDAQAKALREETRLRRLGIESSREGIVILTLNDHRVIDANAAFAGLLQRQPWEVLGMHTWDWEATLTKEHLLAQAQIDREEKNRAPIQFETRWRRKDGTEIDVQVDGSYFEIDGQAYGYHTCRDITERKQVERALRESEAKFRAMFESTRRGIGLFTPDGRHLESNPVVYEHTGARPEASQGRYFWEGDWWAEDDRIRLKDAMLRAGNGEHAHLEVSQHVRSGKTVISEFSIAPIFDATGQVTQILVEANDITERKTAELALRESESKFRTFFETTRRLIGVLTPDGKHVDSNPTNPTGYAFTGLSEEETAKLYFWEGHWWLDDEDRNRIRDAVQRAAQGEYVQFEIRLRAADGKIVTSDFSIAPIQDDQGNVVLLMPEASDITALKETQAVLAHREQLLTAILKQAPGGVVLVNERTHQVVEFNDFACAMHGYSREAFAGLTVIDLKAEATPAMLQERRSRTIAEGQISFEDKHRRADGSTFDVGVSLSRICLNDECHIVSLWIDISGLKMKERALREKEQEVRTLVEHTPDGMVRYDRELRRVYVNPAMANFMGSGYASAVGKQLEKPLGIINPERYNAALKESFRTGRCSETEVQFVIGDQGPRWAQIRFAPEFDANGEVATVLAVAHDVTEIVEHRERVHQLAYSDALTSLPNRALFNERFRHEIAEAERSGFSVGLFLLDLDHFKDINDSLGHAAGDELLRQVATRLAGCVREGDTLARLGGDEFAVILSKVRSGDDTTPVADRVLQAFLPPFLVAGQEIFASASIGVSVFPLDGHTADELFARADVAMYDAKKKGRGGVQFYVHELTEVATRRLALGTSLHSACANAELELYFQPKMRLSDKQVTGAEALLRWRHPKLGLLAPDAFIGVAEETGHIVEIGRWVLETACRAAVRWNSGGGAPLKVAVNLSSRQFMHNDLVADVRNALAHTGCRGEWLECEITESLILRDELDVHSALAQLSAMGISIAIDDFGTGQSALAYLNRFHVDVLKIDRSFVDGMEKDTRKAELARAFISIAAALEMETVAEGIETQKQAEMLQSFGCLVGQGYLLGRPMPVADFERTCFGVLPIQRAG